MMEKRKNHQWVLAGQGQVCVHCEVRKRRKGRNTPCQGEPKQKPEGKYHKWIKSEEGITCAHCNVGKRPYGLNPKCQREPKKLDTSTESYHNKEKSIEHVGDSQIPAKVKHRYDRHTTTCSVKHCREPRCMQYRVSYNGGGFIDWPIGDLCFQRHDDNSEFDLRAHFGGIMLPNRISEQLQ